MKFAMLALLVVVAFFSGIAAHPTLMPMWNEHYLTEKWKADEKIYAHACFNVGESYNEAEFEHFQGQVVNLLYRVKYRDGGKTDAIRMSRPIKQFAVLMDQMLNPPNFDLDSIRELEVTFFRLQGRLAERARLEEIRQKREEEAREEARRRPSSLLFPFVILERSVVYPPPIQKGKRSDKLQQ